MIGASAGGVAALRTLLDGLPKGFAAAVFVILHLPPEQKRGLASILQPKCKLKVETATDGRDIEYGKVVVAAPNRHLTFADSVVRTIWGPKENGHRPSIDVSFRSAARLFGPRVIGVVLTGNLDDGTDGLRAIKRRGGFAVVQDPDDAEYDSMPRSAIAHAEVDRIAPIDQVASVVVGLTKCEATPEAVTPTMTEVRTNPEEDAPSRYVCPECGGTLFERTKRDWSTFRCRVGHAYSTETLVFQKGSSLEAALWAAARALREQADLYKRLARTADRTGNGKLRKRFEERQEDAVSRLQLVEKALESIEDTELSEDIEDLDRAKA